jgi:hypothetical protein
VQVASSSPGKASSYGALQGSGRPSYERDIEPDNEGGACLHLTAFGQKHPNVFRVMGFLPAAVFLGIGIHAAVTQPEQKITYAVTLAAGGILSIGAAIFCIRDQQATRYAGMT